MQIVPEARRDPAVLVETLLPGYTEAVGTLCAQTAHVLAARTLLYRIGEDKGLFPQRLSGKVLSSALIPPSAPLAEPVRPERCPG